MASSEQRGMRGSSHPRAAQDASVQSHRRLLAGLVLVAGIIVAVWLGVAVGVRLAYTDRILPGTRMAGLDLGGRSPDETRRLLTATIAPGQSVTLTGAGRRFVVTATQVGYGIDVPASVARAHDAGRAGAFGGLWSTVAALLAPRSLEPVARVDGGRLRARIAAIARIVDRRARDGALVADAYAVGGIRALAPRAGRTLRRGDAGEAIVTALHDRRPGPLTLPLQIQPSATQDEVLTVARRARDYLRTPLQLTAGSRTLTLTARRTARILALERIPGVASARLRLGVNPDRVRQLVSAIAHDLDRAPSDARIGAPARPAVVVDEQGDLRWRPRRADVAITPSGSGRLLQRAATVTALAGAVRRGRHSVAPEFRRVAARVRTRAARRVTSLLGTFTTRYPCCQPRVTNIRLIADAVDGLVVLPGERFSLNQTTGERARADGYVPAPFIADGKIIASVGGGVSQFSTTLYNAAYFAGLRIDAHRPHSFYIDRYPPGREATLNFPDIDLAWTNDTPAPVLIRTATDATSLTVSLYGADDGRRVRSQTGARAPIASGDFAITVTRVLRYRSGRVVRQPYTTRYDRPPPPAQQ